MSYLELKDLQLNNYKLSFSLDDGLVYGVMGESEDTLKLLKYLAGINKANGACLYEDKDVFDNPSYFNNRIFMDMNEEIVKTLTAKTLEDIFKSRYNKILDVATFKKALTDTNARSEVIISNDYKFSKQGVNLVNYAMLTSLEYKNALVINATSNVNKEKKENIIKNICNKKKYNNVIIGFTKDEVEDYLPYIDRLIILGDFNDVIVIDPKNDTFLYGDDNIKIRNRIFIMGNVIIAKNEHPEDFLEKIKLKLKYKVINFKQALKYRYMEK